MAVGIVRVQHKSEARITTFTAVLLICGTVWITFITIFSVATVGYELKTIRTTDLNGTNKLWYEKFFIHTP